MAYSRLRGRRKKHKSLEPQRHKEHKEKLFLFLRVLCAFVVPFFSGPFERIENERIGHPLISQPGELSVLFSAARENTESIFSGPARVAVMITPSRQSNPSAISQGPRARAKVLPVFMISASVSCQTRCCRALAVIYPCVRCLPLARSAVDCTAACRRVE